MKILDIPRSGSYAGVTSSHNRAGQYVRNRRTPVQPVGTGRRAFIRAAFGGTSSAWSALSFTDQAGWTTYADAHPITDSLGQSINLTGHQMYVAINTQLLNCGQPAVQTPPTIDTVTAPVITVFTASHTANLITLTLDGSGLAADFILVAWARPQSAGRTFVSAYWQSNVLPADSVGNITEGALVSAQFGNLPTGFRLFIKLTPVNSAGVTGVPVKTFVTIT